MEQFEALKALDPNLMSQLLAREYVLEARQCTDSELARKQLQTALRLDPDCPEACLELAAISRTPETAMKWYQKCMDFTKSALGKERFLELIEDFKAQPWQQVELHTYFKAKVSLAEKLFRQGYYSVAILHFEEILAWHPEDDIFLRHFLMVAYLCENKLVEAHNLKMEYRSDLSSQWYYCKAFLQFKTEGDTRRSRRLLQRAFRRNLWAAAYMLGLKEMPVLDKKESPVPHPSSESYRPDPVSIPHSNPFKEGSRQEAVECVRCVAPAIFEDEKLAKWVWEMLQEMV